MLGASDFQFVGKPEAKPVRKIVRRVNPWITRLSEAEPGEGFTLYDRRTMRDVLDWADLNKAPYTVRRYRGGGWRIERA